MYPKENKSLLITNNSLLLVKNIMLRMVRKLKWCGLLLIQIVSWKFIFINQNLCAFWFNQITKKYINCIAYCTSKINFPLGEVFYTSLIIGVCIYLYLLYKKNDWPLFLNCFAKLCFFALLLYNSIWGVLYHKTSFNQGNNLQELDDKYLKIIYFDYLNKAQNLRHELQVNATVPLKLNLSDKEYLNDFKNNQSSLMKEEWISNYMEVHNPNTKPSVYSFLLSYAGVLGYYNPFTVESNVNTNNSPLKIPFTISHELAHQMGFASESEANFIAYYFGIHSNLKEVQYATYYKTIFSLLNSIAYKDEKFVKYQLENLPKGIKVDRDAEIKYYEQYDGLSNEIFSKMNDQFLKANKQDGIVSYSKYIELVYYYEYIIKKGESK